MPLVKGDVHGNIRELISAGHPQKQAVAIALRLAGRRGKVKLSREQDALWPHINDETARLALADYLEEIGDPLHHVLRNEIHYPEGIGDHKFLWVPHSHPNINSLAISYYPGKNWHSVILHSTPHELQLPAIRGKVTTEQLKDILHQHWDRTKNKEGYDRSALYRSGIFNHKEMRDRGYLGLSRPNVIADANSQAQDIRKFIAAKIAKEARLKLVGLEDARGNDVSGVVQAYEAPGDEEGVDYAAAWYGLLTNQPKVTTFHESDNGPDTFYKWKVAGDPDQALKTLPPGTLITKDNFAHYLDRGSQKPVDNVPGVKGTAVTMQGRPQYRDLIKRYQGPE